MSTLSAFFKSFNTNTVTFTKCDNRKLSLARPGPGSNQCLDVFEMKRALLQLDTNWARVDFLVFLEFICFCHSYGSGKEGANVSTGKPSVKIIIFRSAVPRQKAIWFLNGKFVIFERLREMIIYKDYRRKC